ncbi:unnamed protein product [Mytilus coruscus]|uniref:Uncharacterized protein n=1 Tax=Mytilus coruscus TaxID=42192 RepID=A0A6J8B3G2_MYTCO|nr:unnamed protein product [Mytilus coruscus]
MSESVDEEKTGNINVTNVKRSTAMFTYWPKLGASKKAKIGTIPDPQTWALYKIDILSTTEDYETAARRCKLAEDTSHIETEEEKEEETEKTTPKRKISQPSRYDDCDYEEEEQGCSTIKKKVKSLKSRSGMHRVTSNRCYLQLSMTLNNSDGRFC